MDAPTLEANRLLLRPFVEEDADTLVRVIMSDPQVMEHLPGDTQTPEEQRSCARWYMENYSLPWQSHGYGGWAVCARNEDLAPPGALVGFFGFFVGELKGKGPEVGYGYGRPYWGTGIASEAARAGVDWFFRTAKHDRCYACTGPTHDSSQRVLKKIGFSQDGQADLWGSVSLGFGLLPVFILHRETYLRSYPDPI